MCLSLLSPSPSFIMASSDAGLFGGIFGGTGGSSSGTLPSQDGSGAGSSGGGVNVPVPTDELFHGTPVGLMGRAGSTPPTPPPHNPHTHKPRGQPAHEQGKHDAHHAQAARTRHFHNTHTPRARSKNIANNKPCNRTGRTPHMHHVTVSSPDAHAHTHTGPFGRNGTR